MGIDLTPFIKPAQEIERKTGIPTSVQLAQIMQESTSRTDSNKLSGLAIKGKNLFGVKGTGSAGSLLLPTTEYVNGVKTSTMGNFKAYNSYQESIEDHASVLSLDRYTSYFSKASSVEDFAVGLQKGGYATDPAYAYNLVNKIKKNNLTQYDVGDYKLKNPTSDYKNSGGGDISQTADQPSDDRGIIGGAIYSIFYALFIILIGAVAVIFFLKAFQIMPTFKIPQKGVKA